MGGLEAMNSPRYGHRLNEYQDLIVSLERKDWRNSIQLSQGTYFSKSGSASSEPVVLNDGIGSLHFEEPQNMRQFIENSQKTFRDKNQERLARLKMKINSLINELYDEVLRSALHQNEHRVPFYGIQHPHLENPINLFNRQLQIEQLSFESSHSKYKQQI